MNPDFVDLLRAFVAAEVRVFVVGAYALGYTGVRAQPATWMCGSMRHPRMHDASCAHSPPVERGPGLGELNATGVASGDSRGVSAERTHQGSLGDPRAGLFLCRHKGSPGR